MFRKLKKNLSVARQSLKAIIHGEFFPLTLKSQQLILQSLEASLRRFDVLESKLESLPVLLQRLDTLEGKLESLPVLPQGFNRFTTDKTGQNQNLPEERIIEFLLPYLQEKTAIDVGANRGLFTAFLKEAGFQRIFAIEPHPELYSQLQLQYANEPNISILPYALSDKNQEMELHVAEISKESGICADPLLFSTLQPHNMPAGMNFFQKVMVTSRTLESLISEEKLPLKGGFLKVDTEGHDFFVFKGMPKEFDYPVLMTEFWSPKFVFSSPQIPDQGQMIKLLRERGYTFSISIIRLPDGRIEFTPNMPVRIENAWGNTFYFNQERLFEKAYMYARTIFPPLIDFDHQ